MPTFVNIATPLRAVTELVPTTVAPLETVIVTVAALEVSLLPALSVIQTTGCVANATPLDAPAAGRLMTSFVAVVPVPVNRIVKLEAVPLVDALMITLPDLAPPAVGVNTTLITQVRFLANVPGVGHVLVGATEKSPVTAMLEITKSALFLDDTVIVCGRLETDTGWTPNVRDVGETD